MSGTTIGGNTAWHSGNDGSGSGLVAESVPVYASESDLPSGQAGDLAYVSGSSDLYIFTN